MKTNDNKIIKHKLHKAQHFIYSSMPPKRKLPPEVSFALGDYSARQKLLKNLHKDSPSLNTKLQASLRRFRSKRFSLTEQKTRPACFG